MFYYVFTDGACKGNPGPASIGVFCGQAESIDKLPSLAEFKIDRSSVFEISKEIGTATNNQAEYESLLAALEKCNELDLKSFQIYMDSQLVIQQIIGNYKVKNAKLKPLFIRAIELSKDRMISFIHIPREKNQIADFLANQAFK